MQQNPSLVGPRNASGRLSGLVGRRRGLPGEGACEGLNPHRDRLGLPAASFNLRLSEILPGPGEDFGKAA